MTEEKELTMEEIENLSKYVHMEGVKDSLNSELKKVTDAKSELLGSLTGLDNEKDFLSEKLAAFDTVETLKAFLKPDKNVDDFFVNPTTGEELTLSIDIDDEKRARDFKRELLIYMKTSDVAHAQIDREYEELEKATAEIDKDLKEVCSQLSDNVLTYIGYLRDKANESEDEVMKKRILTSCRYIESGYTLDIYNETLDNYPSVARHTVEELTSSRGVETVGARYLKKLKANDVKVSLIPLISNKPDTLSIEETVLIKDDEYVLPDLFIYSIIRYFSMADWSNGDIKKAHASIALVMKRLLSNELEDEVKQNVLTAMVKYLARFK
jgi:hypothetical protein